MFVLSPDVSEMKSNQPAVEVVFLTKRRFLSAHCVVYLKLLWSVVVFQVFIALTSACLPDIPQRYRVHMSSNCVQWAYLECDPAAGAGSVSRARCHASRRQRRPESVRWLRVAAAFLRIGYRPRDSHRTDTQCRHDQVPWMLLHPSLWLRVLGSASVLLNPVSPGDLPWPERFLMGRCRCTNISIVTLSSFSFFICLHSTLYIFFKGW